MLVISETTAEDIQIQCIATDITVKSQNTTKTQSLRIVTIRRPINVIIAMSKFFYSVDETYVAMYCNVVPDCRTCQSVAFLAVYEVKCRPVRFTGCSRGYLRQNPDSSALQLRCLGANDDLPFPQLLLLPLVSQTLLGHSVGGNVSNGGNVTSAGWQVTLGHRDKLNLVV